MTTKKITLAAMFLALGLYLPFLTGQIPEIGSKLLPMHIPVLLCGFICGWKNGLLVGIITPLLRSFVFGMPPFPVTAVPMAFELAAYGAIAGFLYYKLPKKPASVYVALITAMIIGRVVWGSVRFIMLLSGVKFSWALFISGAFINAIPGIILQIVAIPLIIIALDKVGMMKKQ